MTVKPRPLMRVEVKPAAPVVANEHARVLVEFLKRAGTGQGRRWMAALARVDPKEREAVVAEVERLIAERFGEVEVTVVRPPLQRRGYVEQTETTYRVKTPGARASGAESRRARRA